MVEEITRKHTRKPEEFKDKIKIRYDVYDAQWNMAKDECERWNKWIMIAEAHFSDLQCGIATTQTYRKLYSVLSMLYYEWRPIISYIKDFDEVIQRVPYLIAVCEKTNDPVARKEVIKELRWLFVELFEVKQWIGFGVPVTKRVSLKRGLDNVLGSGRQ